MVVVMVNLAVLVDILTDNRNRTAGEVRSYFTKAGGELARRMTLAMHEIEYALNDLNAARGALSGRSDGFASIWRASRNSFSALSAHSCARRVSPCL